MAKTNAMHLRDLKIDRLLKETERLEAENRRLRKLLAAEIDDGRAEVDDIGVEAWIQERLAKGE